MGPFIFEDAGKLALNPFTWNKIANIFYVEQPAGVGFSKYSDPEDAHVGDERAAMDNYNLIKAFLERFPERKLNDFYVASESFGGHYIPWCKFVLDYVLVMKCLLFYKRLLHIRPKSLLFFTIYSYLSNFFFMALLVHNYSDQNYSQI